MGVVAVFITITSTFFWSKKARMGEIVVALYVGMWLLPPLCLYSQRKIVDLCVER